jgi:hypothetical protein
MSSTASVASRRAVVALATACSLIAAPSVAAADQPAITFSLEVTCASPPNEDWVDIAMRFTNHTSVSRPLLVTTSWRPPIEASVGANTEPGLGILDMGIGVGPLQAAGGFSFSVLDVLSDTYLYPYTMHPYECPPAGEEPQPPTWPGSGTCPAEPCDQTPEPDPEPERGTEPPVSAPTTSTTAPPSRVEVPQTPADHQPDTSEPEVLAAVGSVDPGPTLPRTGGSVALAVLAMIALVTGACLWHLGRQVELV